MSLTENLLFATILGIALLPLSRVLRLDVRKPVHLASGVAVVALVLLGATARRPAPDVALSTALPLRAERDGMRSSGSCQGCHPGQYASWHASFHRTMTQVADRDSVVAPFDGRKLEGRGRTFVVERRGEEFWVRELQPRDPARTLVSKRVVMTTGSRHQQVYWTAGPGGSLVQFPWVYEIAEGRWIPTEDSFLRPEDWTQQETTWNRDCIRCHSVGPRPNLDFDSELWRTEVTEIGIACASCHGPAEEHIRSHHNPLHRHRLRASDRSDPTIVNARRLTRQRSSEVCGQCHSFVTFHNGFFADDWTRFRAGKGLEDHFALYMGAEHEDSFWPDGSSRIGGREYNAMILSGCYTNGELTCLSCHAMHGDEPRDQLAPAMDGDEACLQCHADFRDRLAEHTFHEPAGSGSRCYNCHMPYASYALLGAARVHRVDSPTASGRTTSERPNACNLCHLDRTLAWTAEHLTQWYDAPPVELEREHEEVAAGVLWALRGDAAQRAIVAWHMGQRWARDASGGPWVTPYLARLLVDPYSAIRLIAHRSLRQLDGERAIPFDYIGPPDERERASRAVLDRWVRERAAGGAPAPPAVLIEEHAGLRQHAVEELVRQRDDRRLILAE